MAGTKKVKIFTNQWVEISEAPNSGQFQNTSNRQILISIKSIF